MTAPYRPLSPYPTAAFQSLKELTLRIATLEQRVSEARTGDLHRLDLAAHPATRRLLDELEFLHASHARVLFVHASLFAPAYEQTAVGESGSVPGHWAQVSGTLEDVLISTYESLNVLAAFYTRLHTLAVAFEHHPTAVLSLNHLKAITPKVMTCSQAITLVTTDEALRRFGSISPGSAENALEATQAAWKNETQFPVTT